MLLPPSLPFLELLCHSTRGSEGFQRIPDFCICLFIIRQSAFCNAQIVFQLLFFACRYSYMTMQRGAGFAAVQDSIGKNAFFNFCRIPFIPVIAAEYISVAAIGVCFLIGSKEHQRRFVLPGMHPGRVGVGDGLQFFFIHRPRVPFQVVPQQRFLVRQELGQFHIGIHVAGNFLVAFIFQRYIPKQRVIILRHKQLKGGSEPVSGSGKSRIPRRM